MSSEATAPKDSAQRRWNQRRYILEESSHTTKGARTTFIELMTPGTTVPPHYHNNFSETFDLVAGSMSVTFIDPSSLDEKNLDASGADLEALESTSQALIVGETLLVAPGFHHRYQVGDDDTILRAIIEPADEDFERLLMILNGLAADGELQALGNSSILMAVVMDLSDAHLLGPAKEMLDGVRRDHVENIKEMKQRLLAKYDNAESREALMQNAHSYW